MNGVFFNEVKVQTVSSRLGQVLLGLCSSQLAPPPNPFRLTPGVIPDEPPVPHPEPRRHLVCQNPRSDRPQKALGPVRRNPFGQSVKHGPKGDPNPSTPQHLRGRMITESIPWSVRIQTIRIISFRHGRVITHRGTKTHLE